MIDRVDKNCCSCGACYNVCKVKAITFNCNDSYFYTPKVDYSKCISCKQCIKVCPAISYKQPNNNKPQVYAIYANDEERKNSSSGAFFPILAEYVLKNNGYVCGAAWDENWNVHHVIINNIKDLYLLRFSKYVQSNIEKSYLNIENLLLKEKIVLFSGTPCQNAGLKKFLKKEYKNLITMDLLCHGSPSPKIWSEYLSTYYDKTNISEIVFRSKEKIWTDYINSAFINDGKKKSIGSYYNAFLKHILSPDSCMDCKYKYVPRPADFTCGDFWSYKKYDETLNDTKGLSIVLLNTKKAKEIFKTIKKDFLISKKIKIKTWEDLEITNKSRDSKERKLFYKNISKYSLNKSLTLAARKHFDIGLVSQFNGMNYGSLLVAYAANKVFEDLGYSVLMINKPYNSKYPYDERNKSYTFAKENMYLSYFYERNQSCIKLNNLVDTFVVGSDTQWWWNDQSESGTHAWLDFVKSSKKKISFSTSFANDFTDIPTEQIPKIKYLYSRFDAISCREESGQQILKNIFNVDSELLFDPTFIVDSKYFNEIAEKSKIKDEHYFLAYILDYTPDKVEALDKFAKSKSKRLRIIPRQYHLGEMKNITDNNCSIEDFLYLFKNADFIISDSFHGSVFSILNEKPFVTIINKKRGNTRFRVFEKMNLKERFIDDISLLETYDFTKEINYLFVKKIIEHEKQRAISWLKDVLNKPVKKITAADEYYDYVYENKINNKNI